MESTLESRFNKIYNEYSNLLFSVIYPYLHNKEEASDALQDVFLSFLKSNPNLEGDNLKYWLIRVAINTSKNYLKNPNRANVELLDDYDYETIDESKKDNYILDMVYRLKDKYKSVIILYYYEDLSIQEISSILKISTSGVKTRLDRAREMLKIIMEEK